MEIKKKNKIIVTIIISFIILLLGTNYSMADEYPLSRFETRWGYNISWAYTLSADNIYCLEEGDGWPRDTNYLDCWWRIEIYDGIARMYGGESDRKVYATYEGEYDEEYGVIDNDLMASILYFGTGYGTGGKSSSQKAVYSYMNRWLKRAGMSDWSQQRFASGREEYGVSQRFVDYADKYTCNVKMYFLVNKKSSRQNLLLVERDGKKQKRIDIPVEKVWDDKDNKYDLRPDSITVKLLESGNDTGQTLILDSSNNWKGVFEDLDPKGNYSIEEVENSGYITTITGSATKGFKITNELITYDGYIEISGRVWVDKPDGKDNNIDGNNINKNSIDGKYKSQEEDSDSKDEKFAGMDVRLKYIDEEGNSQLFNKNLPNLYETKTNSEGEYKIIINYDNSQKVYKLFEDIETINKKLETAYVEFEYDGMKYTTVAKAETGANTSKAVEDEEHREKFDEAHKTVNSSTTHPDEWTDKMITASTNKVTSYEKGEDEIKYLDVEYCNGDGSYVITNPYGAWKDILQGTRNLACNSGQGHSIRKFEITVQKIPNINLGLFEREQPDVAIFSDLTKVEVEMNKQKYTYLYGVRGTEKTKEGLQAKFQNKDTYTYRRPVNPADIAYLREDANEKAMSVVVTYEVKVGNLSTTLPITVNKIANYYDKRYTLNTEGLVVNKDKDDFNIATKEGLNLTVDPRKRRKSNRIKIYS